MQIKVSEATPLQLDWMVTSIEFPQLKITKAKEILNRYSTDPSKSWPIIDREYIDTAYLPGNCCWVAVADLTDEKFEQYGPTSLVAAMRCYVVSKLGEEVEVPDELT